MYLIPKPDFVSEYEGSLNLANQKLDELTDVLIDKSDKNPEGYTLRITDNGILITAGSEQGAFRAKTTLRQLAFSYRNCLPYLEITDSPRFSFRGFMIDSARHMQTIDELKTMIEAASLFKFNVFHWHLSDDQGFRIELEKHPDITKKASIRKSSEFNKKNFSSKPYGGYYTKKEIKEIIDYCHERYIKVIPELDIPGHTTAILHARTDLSCRGANIELKTRGGIFPDILCAGNPDTYNVIKDILDEICEIFPDEYIHLGGDEAPKVRWDNCPKCKAAAESLKLENMEQLQGHFVNTFSEYLQSRGKSVIVWNESINGGNLNRAALVQLWMDKENKAVRWANSGNSIILSPFRPYYMDYPYGMYPLKQVYSYEPLHLKGLDKTGQENVKGVESPVWTEHISDFDTMTYMCFPRFMAVAETAWTSPEKKGYPDFEKRAEFFCRILNETGLITAPKKDWNPLSAKRISETARFFFNAVSLDMIRGFISPDKESKDEKN
ncbi:MAG: Beta-hexosaminidase [Firmicutes bacterium ADurb.Bin300]|nr:MAG: Beta-hexosaminidase [Firmicutes bacterium ADurb.Bin300]